MRVVEMMIFVLLVGFLLTISGCKKNPVEPPPKNPREYSWTVDTISYPGSWQTMMQDIYGTSSRSVWIVGHNFLGDGMMYHYDGVAWSPVKLSFGAIDLAAITGFGNDDIWVVGIQSLQNRGWVGLILHYDGSLWLEKKVDSLNRLLSVWGSGPSDVWFGGMEGELLHFDGVSIRPDSVPMVIPKGTNPPWSFIAGASNSIGNSYVTLAGRPLNTWTYYYTFRHQSTKWTALDTLIAPPITCLWFSPWDKLYRGGWGVDLLQGDTWKNLMQAPLTKGIHGSAEDNIFAVGSGVYHWNGTDWYSFPNLPFTEFVMWKVWTDGREVFVVGNDGSKSYVLHGK